MTYEEAICKRLGVPEGSRVGCDISGGGEVQIGDYTWDSEPHEFELWAEYGEPRQYVSEKFSDFGELIRALVSA